MKLIFDLNGTLLRRTQQRIITNINCNNCPNYYVYLRNNLDQLADFLHLNNIPYIFWSSANEKNTAELIKLLKPLNRHLGFLSHDDCDIGKNKPMTIKSLKWIKDINKSKVFFGSVDDVYLVDDSILKRKDEQNFIHVKPFEGTPDDELYNLCIRLKEMIHKNNDN